jgi:hypothetical protein
MFPHTHAYATKEITGRSDSLLIYGSILPDIAITKILEWNAISTKAEDFRNWLISKDNAYVDLGLGMMLHEFPCGIDRFTHTSYKGNQGYAIENSKFLIKDVAFCFDVTLDHASFFAHRLIELGVELLVIKDNPWVVELVRTSVNTVDMKKIAQYFSQYYGTKEDDTDKAITAYNQALLEPDYCTIEGVVETKDSMVRQLFGISIDKDKTRAVIKKSVEVVEPDYKDFISYTIEMCKNDIENYI